MGISDNSRVYDGWLNKPNKIGENETYLLDGSPLAGEVKIGDTILVNFSVYLTDGRRLFIPLNLTVKGLAQLNDKASSIARGYYTGIHILTEREVNLLIVNWNKTLRKILDAAYIRNPSGTGITTDILIYIDRDALITPWDVSTSLGKVRTVELQVSNRIGKLGLSCNVDNKLERTLMSFQFTSMSLRFRFTVVSLPIFFMAWYMGTTVSDVSFNLRRREIGLLSTKGFSGRQLLTTFLTETLLIGIIGSALGVLLGFLLNPLFTQFSSESLFNLNVISPYTVAFTMIFGVTIAFFSTFSSARKASKLNTVDALREYLPMEAEKPYKKRWPWVAFILGMYKIAVFASGLNVNLELTRIAFGARNFILILLIGFWLVIDAILNYIGPLLFFWGFMKLFIQGSLKFQEFTAKATRFLGDLSLLATRNVRRNPARSAAIAFLIALIVGYSVQVTGQLASEQDYALRTVHYQVGSDVAVYVPVASDAPDILEEIMSNVSESVQNSTIEYSFSIYPRSLGYLKLKAVEPYSWLETAYYENGWFSGSDISTAFNSLAEDENSIILERRIAEQLNLEIGDSVALSLGAEKKTLKVVGFFGPSESQHQMVTIPEFSQYWSFISEKLYNEVMGQVSVSARLLLKLKGGVNGKSVTETIRNLDLNVSSVESFAEKWEESQSDIMRMGVLDVQRLGIVFAVLAASVGTALVSAVSMRERSREAAIMSVKGLSYKQLAAVFLTENFALVTFSVVLGVIVGLIVVHGYVCSTNASISSLIQHRLVFPLDEALMLLSCIALIFVSTVLPILLMLKRYMTKLERMVRLR
ncbi:hypothetical protein DRO59_07700 [Candidatus Bathyarchaeota archaeon]|nr:MAG: hypothetical protein DRO59_07700 [Candidatus Bathyarchaeota archaeon]